jgi:hypothetical protein
VWAFHDCSATPGLVSSSIGLSPSTMCHHTFSVVTRCGVSAALPAGHCQAHHHNRRQVRAPDPRLVVVSLPSVFHALLLCSRYSFIQVFDVAGQPSCSSHVTSCSSHVTSCSSHVTSCSSHVTSCSSHVTSCSSHVTSFCCRPAIMFLARDITAKAEMEHMVATLHEAQVRVISVIYW